MTLATYLPSASSLSADELSAARALAVQWLAATAPELDTRPGSVFDGLFLRNAVQLMAAINRAIDLLQADMDAAGVAAGAVTDCDFVQRWLKGLGAEPSSNLRQIGYVLLTFDSNNPVSIPGGTRFVFGSDVFVPAGGTIHLQPAGTGVINRLVRMADSTFAYALQVHGFATSTITQGTTAEVGSVIAGLVGATAQNDFVQGAVAISVPDLARLALTTVHHAGFASRQGTIRQIRQTLPDVSGVSVSATGDADMLRSALTLSGLAAEPCMDVKVASRYSAVVSQPVFLPFVADQEGAAVDAFIGVFVPLHVPQRLISVQAVDNDTVTLAPVWYSRSLDAVRAPLLTCAYSRLEQLRAYVPMPRDTSGRALIELGFDTASQQTGAWFVVTYEAEPAVDAVQRMVDLDPAVGVDVLVRAPTPLVLSSLTTRYHAGEGVLLNSEQILTDLSAYLAGLFGSRAFSMEVMNDFAFSAGAEYIRSVECAGRLHLSVADFVLADTAPRPEVDAAGAIAARLPVPKPFVTDPRTISSLAYIDPGAGEATQTLAAAVPSSIRVLLTSDPVYIHEQ